MVEKHDIMFEILHKLKAFDPIRDPEICDIMLILLSIFFKCPPNFYNDYDLSLKQDSHENSLIISA